MRVAVNGWFAGQLGTGSGQYLSGLMTWLPAVAPDHEYFLVTWAGATSTLVQEGQSGNATLCLDETGQPAQTAWRFGETGTPFD